MKKQHLYLIAILLSVMLMGAEPRTKSVIARGAELKTLSEDFKFTEGPAKSPDGFIYFTDQPNDQILKWDIEKEEMAVFKKGMGRSNGLYFDNDGKLIACADEKNELWRVNEDGSHTVLVDNFQGDLLNAPNDLWIDELGGIYFTDPLYKRPWWDREDDFLPSQDAYYLSAQGELTMVATDFGRPNGIIGDIENQKLYIADIKEGHLFVYDITAPGVLANKKLFIEMGSDGMTIDKERNLYLTGKEGVYVFNTKGEQIDLIKVPQNWTANVTIGGKKNKTLYITSKTGFYSIELAVKGLY